MSFSSLRRILRSARKGLCATCSKTRYPQLEAAGSGHVGCLIYTLETIGGLIKDEHDVTAMHVAARKGQISVLIYIIENNVIEKKDIPRAKNGATPAHDAAGTGHLECLRYLLNCTMASPNDLDANSATPLHWATQNGQTKVVQWLVIDAKAPIDVMTKNGVTPFHLAAVKNHIEVLKWLVAYAFRTHPRPMKLINAKDKNGSTPLYLGAHAGNTDIVKWLTEKGGGDPTIVSKQGMAPLHAATSNGHLDCVRFLFQFGLGTALGGIRTTEGASALHFAAAEGETEIVQWLVNQAECTGNERDYYQSTPLHDAAENGHLIVVKALCDYGSDPTLLDVEGNKPSDLARKNGHSKCSSYLDSYMKRVMWSRVNGVKSNEKQPVRKIQRLTQGKSQIMDKFRNAPSHMMPINAFEDEEEETVKNTNNKWVTVRDLLQEDEIKKMKDQDISSSSRKIQQMTEADIKRQLFEEKLAKEQDERQQKKKIVIKQKKEEDEIRTQFNEEDDDVLDVLKSFDDALQTGGAQKGKDEYHSLNDKVAKQNEEGIGIERKGSKWITQILRKRASSLESSTEKPIRKPRRRGSDPSEWNIPSPPPIPKVKYLMGKHTHIQSHSFRKDVKKEMMASKWGRAAYDDCNDSDESSIAGSYENLSQMKLKQTQKKLTTTNSGVNALDKTPEEQRARTMTRKDTPMPQENVPQSNQTLDKDKLTAAAPIAKIANARLKANKHLVPTENSQIKPYPLTASSQSPTYTSTAHTQAPSVLNRQHSLSQGEESDNSDDESSSEEDSSEYESTESSDSDDDADRPIMAQNIGIHGAKIAKQVMQRMKNQRYPSIFSKPIITLDTIVDIRYEKPYQTKTKRERADVLKTLHAEKRVWDSWRKHVLLTKHARQQAEKMLQRRKKALIAKMFYAWVQVKNEADVEKAERKQQVVRHYKVKLKAKVFTNWKRIAGEEATERNPKTVHQKYLQWLNIQLAALHKNKSTDLLKPLEDGSLIIAIIALISGTKSPRHKPNPKIKLHYQDNWRVAHQFMKKVGINTRDFEPADLANLNEASVLNMFNSILKWADQ